MTHFIQEQNIVNSAYTRISSYINDTPLVSSTVLNNIIGCKIYLKMDALQKTGSFKIRGVLNYLLALKELNTLPESVVTYSTGNHAIAVSYVAKLLRIKTRIYLPQNVLQIKKKIVRDYGSEVIEVKTRSQAESLAYGDQNKGFHYIHPSDNKNVIAGAGTLCYEALLEMQKKNIKPDTIFAPCGGGGLLSGSYLAKELLSSSTELHGVEPKNANDAFLSLHNKKIFRFKDSPDTIADGLRALSISNTTFSYLQGLSKMHLVDEESICFWTMYLMEILGVACEPSAAISMSAVYSWSKNINNKNKIVLILISGGNIDYDSYKKIATIVRDSKYTPLSS